MNFLPNEISSKEELCLVLIKPGYLINELISDVLFELTSLETKIIKTSIIKYDKFSAEQHYIDKKEKDFFAELVDYISSDYSFGIVISGKDAICTCRKIVEKLRITLKEKYSLETDLTRNILHCTSKKLLDGTFVDLDSEREISIFNRLIEES